MLKISKGLLSIFAIAGVACVISCGRNEKFIGTWTSTVPDDITSSVPAASMATSLVSVSFMPGVDTKDGGSVALSSVINVNQPVQPGVGLDAAYEVNVAATASVGGTWSYKGDDDDELVLAFDPSTLKVNIDNNGVTFTQNLLTGAQQPQIDSLTAATAQQWKAQLTRALTTEFGRFRQLEDVKVHKGDILTFEIENPDQTLQFRKAQ